MKTILIIQKSKIRRYLDIGKEDYLWKLNPVSSCYYCGFFGETTPCFLVDVMDLPVPQCPLGTPDDFYKIIKRL